MYTIWVGGTEVTEDYVYYDDAKRLYYYYKYERGHEDTRVEKICSVGQHEDYKLTP
tara:strand:+ start:671 stop:838 length:168 start_codon:yes stop_codon:yes gene_type:complete